MNYQNYLTKAIIIILLATNVITLLLWQISKYENEKNQEINQIKLEHLNEKLNEKLQQ